MGSEVWKLHSATDVPRQHDGDSCGLHVISYAYLLSLGKTLTKKSFDATYLEALQKKVVVTIVKKRDKWGMFCVTNIKITSLLNVLKICL